MRITLWIYLTCFLLLPFLRSSEYSLFSTFGTRFFSWMWPIYFSILLSTCRYAIAVPSVMSDFSLILIAYSAYSAKAILESVSVCSSIPFSNMAACFSAFFLFQLSLLLLSYLIERFLKTCLPVSVSRWSNTLIRYDVIFRNVVIMQV